MIKYKLRRYFEYVTLKTPILSLLAALAVFLMIFLVAAGAAITDYQRYDAYNLEKNIFYIKIDSSEKYDEDEDTGFFYSGKNYIRF